MRKPATVKISRARKGAEANWVNERLEGVGLRLTPQRQHVYHLLATRRDHPTAEEVFIRAKSAMPEISFATVYNCLDALVKSGLIKQVHVDRSASRFCPNMHDHCHFHCERCGHIFDIDIDGSHPPIKMPPGFAATQFDLAIRGHCPGCASRDRA